MPNSDGELRILDADECYELLKSQQIGRLGVNAEHYPLIFPVNYGIDRGVIVIRTEHLQPIIDRHPHLDVQRTLIDAPPLQRAG